MCCIVEEILFYNTIYIEEKYGSKRASGSDVRAKTAIIRIKNGEVNGVDRSQLFPFGEERGPLVFLTGSRKKPVLPQRRSPYTKHTATVLQR